MIDREVIGRRLIYAAWAVEIIAALIGLTIAALIISVTYEALKDSGSGFAPSGYMDMFLGGLPFIVVAMVELTKIPLATACYTAVNRLWKTTFAFVLILLSIITFETMLNGFERNFTQRTYLITTLKRQLIKTEETISKTKDEIYVLSELTESNLQFGYQIDIEQFISEKTDSLEDIENQRNEARIRYGGEEAKVKTNQLETILNEIVRREQEKKEELERINNRYELQIQTIDETVRTIRKTLEEQIVLLDGILSQSKQRESERLTDIQEGPDYSEQLESEITRIENSFSDRVKNVQQEISKKRSLLVSEIQRREQSIADLEAEKQKRIDANWFTQDSTRKDFDARLKPLRMTLNQYNLELSELSLDEAIRELYTTRDTQIADTRDRFASLSNRAARERDVIVDKSLASRQANEELVRRLRIELATLSTASQMSIATQTRDDDLRRLADEFDNKQSALTARKDVLNKEISEIAFESKQTLDPVLSQLDSKRAAEVEQYDRRLRSRQDQYESDRAKITNAHITLSEKESHIADLLDQRISIRDNIGQKAQASQIYRIAALWFGKDSPADISNDELRFVTIIWFGSLAMITAWTGTMLAFGGLVVRYGPASRRPSKMTQSIRRYFIDRRKFVRQPVIKEIEKEVVRTVEVIKEVPVDKVVFRDVPKEVVRKELVYVPFFTDDPELARQQMSMQPSDRDKSSDR